MQKFITYIVLAVLLTACGTGGSVRVDRGGFNFFYPKHWEPTGETGENGDQVYAGKGKVIIAGNTSAVADIEFRAVKKVQIDPPSCDDFVAKAPSESTLLDAFRSKYAALNDYCADLGNSRVVYYINAKELGFDYQIDSVRVTVMMSNISKESGGYTHKKLLDEFDTFIQSFEPL